MAEYQGFKYFRTYGKHLPAKMDAEEKITKKRLGNPELWRQLTAISNGTYVNHLGRRHTRNHPAISEIAYSDRFTRIETCLACTYGNTAYYLHNH